MGVAGAGAWGLALANAAASAGRTVALWGRNAEATPALRLLRRSPRLPGVALAAEVRVVEDLADLAACDAILVATPAQATREMAGRLAVALPAPRPLVVCAKGIELGTNLFMTEVVGEAAPLWPRAILSGPSFAADVAAGLPTAVALAAPDEAMAVELCQALKGPNLRLYHSTDVRGVEIGGAAKNVLAIACGVTSGLGLGPSAGAALIARGFAELRRFGEAFGARAHTLMGLSGLGDLGAHLLVRSIPQFRVRRRPRPRTPGHRGRRRQARGRGDDGRGADAAGARARDRHADRRNRRIVARG